MKNKIWFILGNFSVFPQRTYYHLNTENDCFQTLLMFKIESSIEKLDIMYHKDPDNDKIFPFTFPGSRFFKNLEPENVKGNILSLSGQKLFRGRYLQICNTDLVFFRKMFGLESF